MSQSFTWNPWHGCHKVSEGCMNCWMHSMDRSYNRDGNIVTVSLPKMSEPIEVDRYGDYKVKPGSTIFTCFSSDFFIEEADEWRDGAWDMIRIRRDCEFVLLTKRPQRILNCLPGDWGKYGYHNVTLAVSCENQKRADERLSYLFQVPCLTYAAYCMPLLEKIDLSKFLFKGLNIVYVGGENAYNARPCRYEWIMDMYEQCYNSGNVEFRFWSTGSNFWKDGKQYIIRKKSVQQDQAERAGLYIDKLPFV